jgi:putative peptide zinc metalloprotease protein
VAEAAPPAAPGTAGTGGELFLVLPSGVRWPIGPSMTIGRGDDATIKLEDRTVSRLHARITTGPEGPVIEDAGSSFGTIVGGEQLAGPRVLVAGAEIRLGNVALRVEGTAPAPVAAPVAAPDGEPAADPNATIVVPVGATAQGLRAAPAPAQDGSLRPRVRSGWALKRVDDGPQGPQYVLHDLRSKAFMRMDADDAKLFELIDGRRTVAELLVEATRVLGAAGPGRLARLVADFGERGLLDGIAPTPVHQQEPGVIRRVLAPREKAFAWVGDYFERAYRHWGRAFFNPLAVTCLVLLSIAGIAVFAYLIGARYGTPFVVAGHLLIGGAVFVAGRFALVLFHELAHGLALAHYGRGTDRAGVKLIMIFPYAFVDTSEAHFESRLHRIVIGAAGPVSDFSIAGLFSILCAVSPRGNVRDVLFQVAFGGYVAGFFNINPFIERDGYQILSDYLREPGLRQRARRQLSARVSGADRAAHGSPVLMRYAVAGLGWLLIGAGFMIVMSLRYMNVLSHHAPHALVVTVFIVFFIVLLLPVPIALGMPLLRRARFGTPEVNRVVR